MDTTPPPKSGFGRGRKAELPPIAEHFASFGDKLPKALSDELNALEQRLG